MPDYAYITSKYLDVAQRYAEEKLQGRLLEHTFGCVETAEKLARRFDCDAEKAAIASYLHDVVKGLKYPEQVALGRRLGMTARKIHSVLPPVLHGLIAAEIAEVELKIKDADIIQAIECHSTGCSGMGDVAKVVFIADFIEFTRMFPGAAELRSHGAVNLDELALAILLRKLEHLMQERRPIDPRALQFWNELVTEQR